MYLKRVELIGFKSFQEKTELEFGPGVAVVVGPNGCGKSNLVDAIRWALGEQSSKSLRGGRMDEIIFSGTQQRKPLNLAEVSLTFSGVGSALNLDYEEVTVTRRLYRSGESEYLLNKNPCRLKDITGLFLDTGVGKDFYSVIGQGRIEEIINSRPEERREIFEEAAGILKYKLRKKEAQRRLDETGENMTRVRDLIGELDHQLEPLTDQAELAGEYRLLLEQANSCKQGILAGRIWQYRDQCTEVELKLQRAAAAVTAAVAEAGQREKQLFELKQRLQEQAGTLKTTEQELGEKARLQEQAESKLELLRERNAHLREQLREINSLCRNSMEESNRLTALSARLEQELEQKRLANGREQERRCFLEQELKQFEEGRLLKALEQKQQVLLNVTSGYNAAEAAVRELTLQAEQGVKREEVLRQEEQEIRDKLAVVNSHQEKLDPDLNACRRRVADLENTRREGLEKMQKLAGGLERARQKEQEGRDALRSLDSRLQLLREQETDLSGYYRGVKAVLQASGAREQGLKGIVGTVVDLVAVEEKYMRAVEVSLGSGLQYIVTSTEESARKAIAFLKRKNLGWATFLPLDTITVRPSGLDRNPGWRNVDGVLGKLAEFVNTGSEYRRIIDFLVGNVVVCRDLEAASRVARVIGYSCQVISLQGEVINPGGSMRGGSLPKRSTGLLGRRHEIDILQKERDRVEQRQLQASGQVKVLQDEHDALKTTRGEIEGQLEKQQEQLARLSKQEEDLARNRHYLEERLETARSARSEYLRERATLTGRLQEAERQAREYKLELAAVQRALEGEKGLYEQGQARRESLEKELTGCLLDINTLQGQMRSLKEKLAQAAGEKERLSTEMKNRQTREEKTNLALADNLAEQEGLIQQLEKQGRSLNDFTDRVKQKQEEVRDLGSKLSDLEAGDQKWRERRQRLEKRKQQLDLEQTRLQAECKLWVLRFNELFGEEEPARPEADFDSGQTEAQLAGLQEQLDALGDVNLGAIEELARLEERITFLNNQLEDLQQGEQSLHKVLAEIDQHMAGYFMQTLELINKNFRKVFGDLFGGGQAFLELTDPDHLLESGVEIIAQPPGKKLQSITLLSTGEKVLTGLALIFAILLYKPAPFYLLDEVESALDEINLGKFTAYLQKLSDQAQFILITHRKQTMDTARIIYGVTMLEPGISKLVSVKVSEKAG